MKLIGIGICILSCTATIAQGGYFKPAEDQSIQLDQIEIPSGTLFSNHLQLQPFNKWRIVSELLESSQFHEKLNPDTFDTLESVQLIKDNVEVLYSTKFDSIQNLSYLKSSTPFLKYFYRDGTHFLSTYQKNFHISLDPLLHFELGSENSNLVFVNRRGFRLQGSVDDRVYFHSDIIETQLRYPEYVNDYVDLYQSFPGAGLYKIYNSRFPKADSAYDYLTAEAGVDFRLSKHIQISLGHGRHFIGSGIRSMLLSDFAAPHFYLRFNTNVWRLHYQNIFAELSPESPGGQGNHLIDKKYMAAHYLSMNITRNWNAGIFESVIFARRNGFELQYLNPVILYRSVEHSLGSPDNVFLGFHSNVLLRKTFSVYAQILFDEFLLKEFFKSDGWWGNKYAFQIGAKYVDAFGVNNLFLQLEYNQVRPYTYTFRDSLSNYTQYHQSLAHPLGANFKELIARINYKLNQRWTLNAQLIYYNKGLDSAGVNYGGNILLNYNSRFSDYGHETGQGLQNEVLSGGLNVSYRLFYRAWIDLNLNFRNSKINQEQKNIFWFSAGFRMNLDKLRFDF
jgi:hypothetical protein